MRHHRLKPLNSMALESNGSFMSNPLTGPFLAYAARLRFPTLFKITLGVFLLDLLIPDFIPFADEILLGLGALILSNWQRPVGEGKGSVIEHEPPSPPPPPPQ
jgi:hypothetical protein